MGSPTPLQRFQAWLAARLGTRYAVVLDIGDRLVVAFLLAFGAQLLAADVLDVNHVLDLSLWQRAAVAGLTAALSLGKSLVMTAITGHPALTSLTSMTLRSRREVGRRVEHHVPLHPNKAA